MPDRVVIYMTVGILGEDEDIRKFAEIMTKDFERRCHRANEKLFGGRLQLLPVAEEIPETEVKERDEV